MQTEKQIAKVLLDPLLFKECELVIDDLKPAPLVTNKGSSLAGLVKEKGCER